MRKKLSIVVALLAIAALAGAGSAQARVDMSYGENGVLTPVPPLPDGGTQSLGAIALSQSGEAYVASAQSSDCSSQGCSFGEHVFRFLSDGSPEPAFGSPRGAEIARGGLGGPRLAVDSAGRLIVARLLSRESGEGIVVSRFLKSGLPDPGFGAGGTVEIPCPCISEGTRLMVGPEGKVFVVAPGHPGLVLIALDANGHRLRGFGTRGVSSLSLPSTEEFTYATSAPNGAMYFGGRANGGSVHASWLARVSTRGKLDTKFTKTAYKSLGRLYIGGAFAHVNSAVTTHKGKIELFGSAGTVGGFELRLLASGKLDKTFGKNGLRLFPYSIASAIRGSEGATMVLSGEELGPPRLFRILGDGSIDKKFGAKGELLPSTAGKFGLVLEPGGKDAVTVVDHGYHDCRFSCSSSPTLYRFLEGR